MSSELERILESLLFLSADPVSVAALADAVEADPAEVLDALERLGEALRIRPARARAAPARGRLRAVQSS